MSNSQSVVSKNIYYHNTLVTRASREALNHHRGCIIWFTGLSGSGKSTLAQASEKLLHKHGYRTILLDGDNVRHGLCADLGFSHEDRSENIRRVGEVSKLFVEAGVIALCAFISPYRADRNLVRNLVAPGDFIEVYCDASIEVCESRDVKGLYKKARDGEVLDFTGVSSPYELPETPELRLNTGDFLLSECAQQVVNLILCQKGATGSTNAKASE